MEDKIIKPPEWGNDSLSEFIERSIQNTYASFHNLKPWFNRIKDIHLVFQNIANNLDSSKDWFSALFLYRSHAALLGGVRLALSGQVPEAYMVLRGCLENALYGLYISRNSESVITWLNRDQDEKSKDKVRREFVINRLLRILKSEDFSLHEITLMLYERTIDLGGHPNDQAFFSMLKMTKEESYVKFETQYLKCEGPTFILCLKSCAQIGINALFIFKRIFRERLDILGISDQLDVLKKGL